MRIADRLLRLREAAGRVDGALWAVLGLALAIRVGFVAFTDDYRALFDSEDFLRHGLSIANGDGYPESLVAGSGGPTAFRGPAYPYFLGGVLAIFDDSVNAGRIAGAALGALAAVFVYLIARELWDRRVATVAGLIVAVFPPLVLGQTAILSEGLFITIELAIVVSVLALRRSTRPLAWAALAGVLCGVIALTRSNGGVLVLAAMLGAWALTPRLSGRALLPPLTVAACAALTIAPWAVRNAIEFDQFIPTTTQGGFGVAGTYNEETMNADYFPGTWDGARFIALYGPLLERQDLDEAELDDEFADRGIDFLVDHPGYLVEASTLNLFREFGVRREQPDVALQVHGGTLDQSNFNIRRWSIVPLALLALLGAALLTLRSNLRWGPAFVWAVPVLVLATVIPISGDPRYRTPVDPFLAMLAGVAIVVLWDFARSRAPNRSPSPGVEPPSSPKPDA